MKEETRLMIEAGIIPQSVAQICQLWTGANEEVPSARDKTSEELKKLVARVAELIENDELPVVRETELDLSKLVRESHLKGTLNSASNSGQPLCLTARVAMTITNKLVVKVDRASMFVCDAFTKKGNEIELSDGRIVVIKSVEPRYVQDALSFYVCDIEFRP